MFSKDISMAKPYKCFLVFPDGRVFYREMVEYNLLRKYKKNIWDGYYYLQLANSRFKDSIHRIVAKLFVENKNPKRFNVVDHINGDRSDNRACNLRWIDSHLNAINKKWTLNAKFDADIRLWRSSVWNKGREKTLGYFTTFLEAHKAAHKYKEKLFDTLYEKYCRE